MQKGIYTVPVFARGDDHEPTKIGNVQYNPSRGTITARIEIKKDFDMLGKSIELGLVESMTLSVDSSEFAGTMIQAVDEILAERGDVEISDI